ncbi:D-alanine--D-alanine ligase family protein [Pseudonocardia sp. GCM10023141]|uniref:D-alanine--D-alanine ligase family protein n=1 Tax=Pseudonocardia sp. GCM10023141 TaxID=3252653 RepID=UPI0036203E0E
MPAEPIRVAVIFGGRSGEHPVSCLSAASILAHLGRERFTAVPVRIDRQGYWAVGVDDPAAFAAGGEATLRALDAQLPAADTTVPPASGVLAGLAAVGACDVAFPALHGPLGEDGALQSCLEAIGIPYVGSGTLAGALGMDKVRTKRAAAAAGLVVADDVVLTGSQVDVADDARERLGLPVFVKPSRSGSSLGVTRVDRWADLPAAVTVARQFDDMVLVEAAVPGREIDIGVLELPDGTLSVSPPLEIRVPDGTLFDYHAKYASTQTVFEVPARLDTTTVDEVGRLAVQAFRALGCAGLIRADFFVRPDGRPVFNEINTFPGFTAASQYPRMWQAVGVSYRSLLDTLIDTALARAVA